MTVRRFIDLSFSFAEADRQKLETRLLQNCLKQTYNALSVTDRIRLYSLTQDNDFVKEPPWHLKSEDAILASLEWGYPGYIAAGQMEPLYAFMAKGCVPKYYAQAKLYDCILRNLPLELTDVPDIRSLATDPPPPCPV